jgi:hypothetical protein
VGLAVTRVEVELPGGTGMGAHEHPMVEPTLRPAQILESRSRLEGVGRRRIERRLSTLRSLGTREIP